MILNEFLEESSESKTFVNLLDDNIVFLVSFASNQMHKKLII